MHFFVVLSFYLLSLALAEPLAETLEDLEGRAAVDFFNPTANGGSFLDLSAGLGEPLNVSALICASFYLSNSHR